MLRFFLAGQLLLLIHAQVFAPTTNCQEPIYLTDSLLSPWVGISIDATDTVVTIVNGINQLKCSDNSLFAYIDGYGVLTRTNWWMDCDNMATNKWRVRDAGGRNTAYGLKAVGCVRPTCTEVQIFDGSEPVLGSHPELELVPTHPSLVSNGKFTFACPSGLSMGFSSSTTLINLSAGAKITCEADGVWSATGSGKLATNIKFGCFKKITRPASSDFSVASASKPIVKPACGCWYEFSMCPTCEWDKLFLLDGFGAYSAKCTIGCAKGYVFEGGNTNIISCKSGVWIGSSSTSATGTVPLSAPQGWLPTSCVPAPTPATCSFKYPTFNCEGCDSSKIIPLQSTKSKAGCVLACDQNYRLLILDASSTVTRAQEAVLEQSTFSVYPLGEVEQPIKVDRTIVKFSCEPATTNTAPIKLIGEPTVIPKIPLIKPACGCWYEFSLCPTCEGDKLFLLDGFGAYSAKCTLGCAKGYVFEGGNINMISCKAGVWIGSSSTVVNGTVPLAAPQGWINTSCVPAPTPAKCSLKYSTFACEGCDATKIIPLQSTKSREECVLACDKDYRLLVLDATQTVTRAQEVIVEQSFFTVYLLGDTEKTTRMDWKEVKFSCEPATASTDPIKLITTTTSAPTTTSTTTVSTTTSTTLEPTTTTTTTAAPTTTTTKVPPKFAAPECGVPIYLDKRSGYDYTKLFVMGSGPGNCTVQCDVGYRLTGFYGSDIDNLSSAAFWNKQWGGKLSNISSSVVYHYGVYFSCEKDPTPATCTQAYEIFACNSGQECNKDAIRAIRGEKSNCILSCAKGYRLVVAGSIARTFQEIFYKEDPLKPWKGTPTGEPHGIESLKAALAVSCERYFSPPEQAKLPPADALTACGCEYKASPCPTCDWQKLFVIDGFGVKSGQCTLACAKGYMFEGGEMNIVSCNEGKWIGSSRTSATTFPVPLPYPWIRTSCVPADAEGICLPSKYSSFDCEGCDKAKIIALPSTKSKGGCVLTCDLGFRLVVLDEKRKYIRAQEAVLQDASWMVYSLGKMSTTISIEGSVAKFSCEPAIEIPPPTGPGCGCPYTVTTSRETYDYTKLFVMDSSPANCVLQCDTGYRLNGNLSSAACENGKWNGVSSDSAAFNLYSAVEGRFSCDKDPITATCDQPYGIAACKSGKECNKDAIRAIRGLKSNCILSCAKGYRLFEDYFQGTFQEIYYVQQPKPEWQGKSTGNAVGTLNFKAGVKINCERYFSPEERARLPPAGVAFTTCGCEYKPSPCPTCDWQKLFVIDGFGATSGKCTLGCAKGYVLEGEEMNMVSCKAGVWMGSSRTASTTVPVTLPQQFFRTSCVPTTEAATCLPSKFSSFECNGSDKTKLIALPSTKSKGKDSCVLACDLGYRLVVLDGARTAIRAQEAVLQQSFWQVYPLGEVDTMVRVDGSLAKFTCEPAVAIATTSASTGPTCGCNYKLLKTCTFCDNTQMIGRHDGAGSCALTCAPGYQLVSENAADGGVLTAVTCTNHQWFGRTATLTGTHAVIVVPSFGCIRTETAKCTSTYSSLSACTTCDSSKLRPVSTWLKCQLGCASGFRLVANSANSLTGAQRFVEVTAGEDNKWSGVLLTENAIVALSSSLFVGCEPDVPTKPLASCGCFFSNQGPDMSQLVVRSVWSEGKNCEIICEPGYYLTQKTSQSGYDMSLIVCEAGSWVGRTFDSRSTITMSQSPSVWCKKMTTDYMSGCTNSNWLPLPCAGCSVEPLLPVPSAFTCLFTCRAGWRIVAQHKRGSITRPRNVALNSGSWIGTGGAGLLTTLYFGDQPLISCEPDTYPGYKPAGGAARPAALPCEYCRQPTKETACPAGKTCVAQFLPLWTTSAGCMQVRCKDSMKMLINRSGTWLTVDGLNCEANGSWKTLSGVALTADIAVTCDLYTSGKPDLIEALYNIFRKGINLIALDPNYVSPFGG